MSAAPAGDVPSAAGDEPAVPALQKRPKFGATKYGDNGNVPSAAGDVPAVPAVQKRPRADASKYGYNGDVLHARRRCDG